MNGKTSLRKMLRGFALLGVIGLLAACGGGGGGGGGGGTSATAPSAPTAVGAAAGNAMAQVSFTPPSSNGGAAITGYTVTSSPGNLTATGTASPISVSGLTNGTAYTFTVTATNSAGTSPASAASSSVVPTAQTALYVNGATGLDTNNGSMSAPFKTITAAVNAAMTGQSAAICGNYTNVTINVAPGTYSTGETFPITVPGGISLIGDIANKGSTTIIQGSGSYTYSAAAGGLTVSTTLAAGKNPNATTICSAAYAVSGFQVQGGTAAQVVVDSPAASPVTLASNTVSGSANKADGVYVEGASVATLSANTVSGYLTGVDVGNSSAATLSTSNATLTGNTITGNITAGLNIAGTSTVTAGNNKISGVSVPTGALKLPSSPPAVLVTGGGTAGTSPTVNLGTSVKLPLSTVFVLAPGGAGGNTITGPSNYVGLNITGNSNLVTAAGNTWHASVQSADANGNYALGTAATNPTAVTSGNNYAITSSTGGLNF